MSFSYFRSVRLRVATEFKWNRMNVFTSKRTNSSTRTIVNSQDRRVWADLVSNRVTNGAHPVGTK